MKANRNLLFVRVNDRLFESILKGLIQSEAFSHAYIIGRDEKKQVVTGFESITWIEQESFENDFDRLLAGPGMFNLDSATLQAFRETEATFLTMSDRLSYNPISVRRRRLMYYTLLSYWISFFEKNKIDLIFMQSLPHMGWDYILFQVARAKGIKTVYIERTLINYYVFLVDGPDYLPNIEPEPVDKIQQRTREESVVIKISKTRHPDTFLNDLYKIVISGVKQFIKNPPNRNSAYYLNGKIGRWARFTDQIKFAFFVNKLEKYYKSFCKPVPSRKKFVYFPLHLQPERTTCPMGGHYDFQILALEVLSQSLPDDFLILIKEHPRQFDKRKHILKSRHVRDELFYQKVVRIPKVVMLDYNEDHNTLVNNCTLTATITGSVGWEGIMIGKPAILFGDLSWYERCPGAFKVTGIKDCKDAVTKALQKFEDQVKADMNTFIREQSNYFIEGLNSFEAVKKSGLKLEDVANNMVSNIVAYAAR